MNDKNNELGEQLERNLLNIQRDIVWTQERIMINCCVKDWKEVHLPFGYSSPMQEVLMAELDSLIDDFKAVTVLVRAYRRNQDITMAKLSME